MKRALVVAILLVVAGVPAPAGHARAPVQEVSPPVHEGRAFTAGAEAFPVETAPGTRDTEVAVRQLSTIAEATNPPADAFARAATSDAGLAEAYLGQQGPSADADTATGDGERDDVVEEGGNRLEAHADPSPRASAAATGNVSGGGGAAAGSGTGSSASRVDAATERLVATAAAEINDVAIGPLVIGSGRFDAVATADGTPGGASGSGQVVASDATFGGIPVVVGADGVAVDEARVPDPLVGPSTAALQEAFSQGGFTDIRVVQPHVEVAADGSAVRVSGGGIFVFLTNNDPAERYFVSHTLLGGSVEIAFGGVLARPTATAEPPVPAVASPSPPDPAPVADRPGAGGSAAPTGGASPPLAPAVLELTHAQGTERLSLPGPWPGWVWSLVVVAAGWAVAGGLQLPFARGARVRLLDAGDGFADRYLRG